MLGRLCDQLAGRIVAQEGLHQFPGLLRATGLGQRVDEGELCGLKFRIELERPAKPLDGFINPAELQEAAAEFLMALGVVWLLLRPCGAGAARPPVRGPGD